MLGIGHRGRHHMTWKERKARREALRKVPTTNQTAIDRFRTWAASIVDEEWRWPVSHLGQRCMQTAPISLPERDRVTYRICLHRDGTLSLVVTYTRRWRRPVTKHKTSTRFFKRWLETVPTGTLSAAIEECQLGNSRQPQPARTRPAASQAEHTRQSAARSSQLHHPRAA